MILRRFRFKQNEYQQIAAWLKKQENADKGIAIPSTHFPKITWAHKTKLKLQTGAHGKKVIAAEEKGLWKTILHEKEIDQYLRDALLSDTADVPLSRDAGYHIIQQRTIGISRRTFQKFIAKQAVLQITRDRPAAQKKQAKYAEQRGYLEMDLIEAKGRDIGKHVHHPVKDFYWIAIIDRLTGYLEVKRSTRKNVESIAPKIETMLRKMAKVLKTNIKMIRSDKGSEFKSDTQTVLERLKIRHRFVKSGNRIEQANKTFQKIWYRLMRLGRGDLSALDTQAQAIFNNTISSITKKTPFEALETEDKVLTNMYAEYQKRKRVPKYRAAPIKKDDLVRYIIEAEAGKHGSALKYKSYRGKHWSMRAYRVTKVVDNVHQEKYFVHGEWRRRDQLLVVPGVDLKSRAVVVAKHRKRKKDYVDELKQDGYDTDLALGDPDAQPY